MEINLFGEKYKIRILQNLNLNKTNYWIRFQVDPRFPGVFGLLGGSYNFKMGWIV